MNQARHPSLADLSSRLQAWAREHAPALTDNDSADIHTDELGIDELPGALLDTTLELFTVAVEGAWPCLDGFALVLMIPLRDSRVLRFAPHWQSVPKLLSRTPPSFYILRPRSYFQPDDATRLVSPVEGMPRLPRGSFAEFRCWRNADLAPSEPWARDIRIVSIVGHAVGTTREDTP